MSLTTEQVRHVAHLARLGLDEVQIDSLSTQLGDILGLVDALSKADTASVTPMAHPLDMGQRGRADVVTESDRREAYQAIAPSAQDGLYRVPRVIE
ncbi:Asp-tRNA(Asn)/Glu-tRNA(Gln) amidotransferase subunit GatC [Algiphilus sp.]|uniref:Asp-tRNA(Asn)/Glu-tRNA(Gln) amidotransferase subunit GatC n=1 Tax=Algiphilus sp. TaxID=1872431 RepID=UPI001CA7B59D|nr:Asp-tRNA(Asn)/Glu-tRNA(Gln) amidotransferase subunit GatC [Algiphilus sp.]MBY8966212.1 Asp-tRNA(Asn)/Glu-tRNA(Gln) amidotransferase subunit GatC [Algiphilus acroporae]MCI5061614.1 Asp-tRNA(Asn)/Glu-tRNA(Gln) amidotransferase subunit GatC [Algiphilus sp.]MCI5104572.1 Asp-tRNA(Asn)/Glu-tRNA(Gln) amidotransferase subunit GatC [Algiphilus sp.]